MLTYDAWKLSGPDEGRFEVGTDEGQICCRYSEPDEDAPRGYKPKPCRGEIIWDHGVLICDTCGETCGETKNDF